VILAIQLFIIIAAPLIVVGVYLARVRTAPPHQE
jgi:hypothetical protein